MLRRKYKLIRFHAESLGASTEVPACEDLQIIALFEAEDGTTVLGGRLCAVSQRVVTSKKNISLYRAVGRTGSMKR
jgi:hypothetical protein